MVKVVIPKGLGVELEYTINIVLEQFLGLSYIILYDSISEVRISVDNEARHLVLGCEFFLKTEKDWLGDNTLPKGPLPSWILTEDNIDLRLCEPEIPVLYGTPGITETDEFLKINSDLLGGIFFMLSRYEELVIKEKDAFERFPATASCAYKEGFIHRPIVDEYVELTWYFMQKLFPSLERTSLTARNNITCDLDCIFNPLIQDFGAMVRATGRSVIKKKDLQQAIRLPVNYALNFLGIRDSDEFQENIFWMMDVNEAVGNKMSFYFIPYSTCNADLHVNFGDKSIRAVLQQIHDRGHELGIHPGYETYNNAERFNHSVQVFREIMDSYGIQSDVVGGRQHFLRWDAAITPHLWEQNGLDYDSTLSFADIAGFRCGTGHEFPMYDLVNRKTFNLRQKPLVTMECTLLSHEFEDLGYSKTSLDKFHLLKNRSLQFGGNYTLLWHNSFFEHKLDKVYYQELIK